MEEDIRSAEIHDPSAEAAVIASVLVSPSLCHFSDDLSPKHFADEANAYLYFAVRELVTKHSATEIDALAITQVLEKNKYCGRGQSLLTKENVDDAIEHAKLIARSNPEDYRVQVNRVLESAFKRNTLLRLKECELLCRNGSVDDVEQKLSKTIDEMFSNYSHGNEVPEYGKVVRKYWEEIKARQSPESFGAIPFKFKSLNSYVMIERGELVVFGGEPKAGKSMLMLNCAVDLLRRGLKVLYLDSELNDRLFTCRMIAHLTGIPFVQVRGGGYNDVDKKRIDDALAWLEKVQFTHIYMPIFDQTTVYTTVKKLYYQQRVDILIIDYFKGGDNPDAFATYQALGGFCDMVKNRLCGELNIAGIGAAQSNAAGRLADSAKIDRNASTIVMIENKDRAEIETDGEECGNKKLFVRFNRNGPQMSGKDEYIDMVFDGDHILYEEAKQHLPQSPF